MDLGLDGCVAVVTGASAGIGAATTELLAAQGAHVVAVARRSERLSQLAMRIQDRGFPRPVTLAVDLAAPGSATSIARAVHGRFGRLDVLVNNAGGADRPDRPLDEGVWQRQFELNFHSKRRLTEELLPLLRAGGRGRVINLAGILEPFGVSAAQAAVAALVLWSKGLSRQVAASGVTVNCVAPGRVQSEQLDALLSGDARREFVERFVPAGRVGEPQEVANLVTFLASVPASYLTGELITVDGGMHRSI